MTAQIKFEQGPSLPPSGQALLGVTGVAVIALDGSGDGPVASYAWTILDVPTGSVVPVGSAGSLSTITFTPDIPGGYLIRLTTNVAGIITSDIRAVLVPEDTVYNRIIPPYSASADALNISGQARGWSTYIEQYLRLLNRLRNVSSAAPNNADVLTWNSVNNRYEPAALPGIAWPGASTDLIAGDGTVVTVGDGLTLSSATLVGTIPRVEIPILAGVASANSIIFVRCASKEIDISAFPPTFDGKNLTITLKAVLEVTSATAILELYDITPLVPVIVTNSQLTTLSTTPTLVTSPPLLIGTSPGNIYTSPAHLYELDIQVSGGVGTATCSGAWLVVEYV